MLLRKSILFSMSETFAKRVDQSSFFPGMVLLKTCEDSEVKFKVCARGKQQDVDLLGMRDAARSEVCSQIVARTSPPFFLSLHRDD